MAAQRKKKSSKRGKKLTLREFQAWLQGVEELQPDDWSPTAEQWTKIREKIDNIVEEEPQIQYVEIDRHYPGSNQPHGGSPPHEASPAGPPAAGFEPAGGSQPIEPTGPPVARSTLEERELTLPSGGGHAGGGSPLPVATDGQGRTRIKTPDIDTSDGTYTTSFE